MLAVRILPRTSILVFLGAASLSLGGTDARLRPGLIRFVTPKDESSIKLALRQLGVQPIPGFSYNPGKRETASPDHPVLIQESAEGIEPKTWDILVPFGQESMWVETLRDVPGVSKVLRLTADMTRGLNTTAPENDPAEKQLPVAGVASTKIEASDPAQAFQQIETQLRKRFGSLSGAVFFKTQPDPQAAESERQRRFRVTGLHGVITRSPPYWERLDIDVVLPPSNSKGPLLRIAVSGLYASGILAPPAEGAFKSMQTNYLEALNDYASQLSNELEAILKHPATR